MKARLKGSQEVSYFGRFGDRLATLLSDGMLADVLTHEFLQRPLGLWFLEGGKGRLMTPHTGRPIEGVKMRHEIAEGKRTQGRRGLPFRQIRMMTESGGRAGKAEKAEEARKAEEHPTKRRRGRPKRREGQEGRGASDEKGAGEGREGRGGQEGRGASDEETPGKAEKAEEARKAEKHRTTTGEPSHDAADPPGYRVTQ